MKKLFFAFVCFLSFTSVSYSKQEIEVIVPYGAGGGTDNFARRIVNVINNDKLEFAVVNKTGGAANIAFNHFVNQNKAILIVGGQIIENEKFAVDGYPKNMLEVAKPLFFVGEGPQFIYTSLNVNTIDEIIKLSEKKDIVFGGNTPGTSSYEIYNKICNVQKVFKRCNYISYRSSSFAIPDLLAGRIDVYANSYGAYNAFTGTGKAKAIVSLGPNRFYLLPDVPTLKEKNHDLEVYSWMGIFHKNLTSDELKHVTDKIKNYMTVEEHKKYGYEKIEKSPEDYFQFEIKRFRGKK